MRVFISQPMTGFDEKDILAVRDRATKDIMEYFKDTQCDVTILQSYFHDSVRDSVEEESRRDEDTVNWDIFWLSQSLSHLALADVVWMCDGWQYSIGCKIENHVAAEYGIPVIYPMSDFEKEEHNGK